jgi:stringent starvation protein B
LIRALHDWCTDNGFTPYVAVYVDASVQVPLEYVKNQEIVLNVGFEATSGLRLGNEVIEFKARFGGVSREIIVPIDHVIAIYARENGQGMAFPVPNEGAGSVGREVSEGVPTSLSPPPGLRLAATPVEGPEPGDDPPHPEPSGPFAGGSARPSLKRVK